MVAHLTLQIFLKIRSSGAHSEATQSPRHGFLILPPEINKKFPHEQILLKADKRVCVDKLIGMLRGQRHFISHGRNTNESHELSNRVQIGCAVRGWIHQGRQRIQTSRTLAVLELEYLSVDEKTIDGRILSSLLRKLGRESLRESFGAKLDAAFMTVMISGPR